MILPTDIQKSNNFMKWVDEIHKMQEAIRQSHDAENERNKEVLRQRDLQHCRNVNHARLADASNELRELKKSLTAIEAQHTNLAYVRANERARFNSRLKELQQGAQTRALDDADTSAINTEFTNQKRAQQQLREAYNKQLADKHHEKHLQFLALEEERRFIDDCIKAEQKKALEKEYKQILDKQRWQSVIDDFKAERKSTQDAHKELLRKEDDKIAAITKQYKQRAESHKEALLAREKVIDAMRKKLAQQMKEKEQHDQERQEIEEELRLAESEEERQRQVRLEKAKRAFEKNQMSAALRASLEKKQTLEDNKRKEWQEYSDILKSQAEEAADKERRLNAWRAEKANEAQREWESALAHKQRRQSAAKADSLNWRMKEEQDTKFWQDFVDLERKELLKEKWTKLKDFVNGYDKFPKKKDNVLFQSLTESESGTPSQEHVLAQMEPPEDTHYSVYRNMLDARVSEAFGIGAK
ncbi:trichohyalin-like [Paramacrobiotus metropolitanus]|uniref:trichohyalin-like n=1 Tax=Paramacrobiotus metropolitanus TaxID=2943436 RepID=UPI002445A9D0|nr:trichohyalin-like [Paramacrobiotus metropolitanus]